MTTTLMLAGYKITVESAHGIDVRDWYCTVRDGNKRLGAWLVVAPDETRAAGEALAAQFSATEAR